MSMHKEEAVHRRDGFAALSVQGFKTEGAWSYSTQEGGGEAEDEQSVD